MPLFEYVCAECAANEERNVSIAERDNQECECGSSLTRRYIYKGLVYAPTAGGMK